MLSVFFSFIIYVMKLRNRIATGFISIFLITVCIASDYEKYGRNDYSHISYFYIEEIERDNGVIEIEFNSPLDPATVTPERILINNKPFPNAANIRHSRKGDKLELIEDASWRQDIISIQLKGICSISGVEIESLPPVFLYTDQEYEREDDLDFVYWYWYDNHEGKIFSE